MFICSALHTATPHLDLTIYAAYQLKKPFSVKRAAVKNTNKYTPPFRAKTAS